MTNDNIKCRKKPGFTLSLEGTFFGKTAGMVKLSPAPSPTFEGLTIVIAIIVHKKDKFA